MNQEKIGRIEFTYSNVIQSVIDLNTIIDVYKRCRLVDGTYIPQISVMYNNKPDVLKHGPSIEIYFEDNNGDIYIPEEEGHNEREESASRRRRD